jgi:hypothetical protein
MIESNYLANQNEKVNIVLINFKNNNFCYYYIKYVYYNIIDSIKYFHIFYDYYTLYFHDERILQKYI